MSNDTQNHEEKNPLDIVNDKSNYISASEKYGDDEDTSKSQTSDNENAQEEKSSGLSRRDFLRYGGAAAVGASVISSGIAGFETGRSADAYTGYGRTVQGEDMFFDREPFRAETPAMMTPVGEVTRPEWYEHLLNAFYATLGMVKTKQWNPGMGVEAMPGALGDYYRSNPKAYASLEKRLEAYMLGREYWYKKAYKQYAIANAYTQAYGVAMTNHLGTTIPEEPAEAYAKTGEPQPPEKWDYRRVTKNKMVFKSPAHATKLIKRMAHMFGASVVGICKFDERFMFKNTMRGMPDKGLGWGDKVPEHWKSIIVFGTPMYWDSTYSAIGYSTSYDGYFKTRLICGMLETFIQNLGHPARAQFPAAGYEIMMSPYTLLSGLAEYSRAGLVMVPELGSNFRPGGVITDIEFEYDKPINIGMAKFCMKCKICAETCPSGAISFEDEPTTVVRGFKRWLLDEDKCHMQWVSGTTMTGDGCRVCIAVCPYSRKNTWIHTISRELEARDKTGIVATALLAMQQNFFKYPAGEEFRAEWDGGREAVYHNPPWWERSEDFFSNVEQTWEYDGMH